jgi:hypothetical protein
MRGVNYFKPAPPGLVLTAHDVRVWRMQSLRPYPASNFADNQRWFELRPGKLVD